MVETVWILTVVLWTLAINLFGLVSRIYKELKNKQTPRNQTTQLNIGVWYWKELLKEKLQIVKKSGFSV